MKYKIFILDDKPENIQAAVSVLSNFADEIKTANSYEEGERVLQTFDPDFAFIDLNFPMTTGGQDEKLGILFRKNFLQEKNIPNVIVTGGIDHGEEIISIEPSFYLPIEKINPELNGWCPGDKTIWSSDKTSPVVWQAAWKSIADEKEKGFRFELDLYVLALRKLRENQQQCKGDKP